jgi:hypothetical protein
METSPWVIDLEPGDHAQDRGLAAARGADKDDEFAVRDVEARALHGHDAAGIGLAHVVQGQLGHDYFSLSTRPFTKSLCIIITTTTGGSMARTVTAMM